MSSINVFKKVGRKRVPVLITILWILLGIAGSGIATYSYMDRKPAVVKQAGSSVTTTDKVECTENMSSLSGYHLIKPLLDAKRECESESLASIKGDLGNYIDQQKQAGAISAASVSIRVLSSDEWTSVNGDETYFPGSLMKLPMLIAFLRMEEAKPGFLDQKVTYTGKGTTNIKQTFETKSIETGHAYTLRELLEYMVAYSDNNATQLLNNYMKIDAINRVFTDIGLTPPPANADYFKYKISAKDFSKFIIGIYNSSFLSNTASEFAAELLTRSDFKDGLIKQLPPNVKVAHKFGEAGQATGTELHETGIIFIEGKPYQITIMTRGADIKKQAEIISQLSKMVYDRLFVPIV